MRPSKLSEHEFKKGKFIPPFNKLFPSTMKYDSWCYGRLPEYLWIALILYRYGRKEGLEKCYCIIKKLHELNSNISLPTFSAILSMDSDKQNEFFDIIIEHTETSTLAPLTIIFTYSEYPVFSEKFEGHNLSISYRHEAIELIYAKAGDQHSNLATDIRFVVVYFSLLSGKLKVQKHIGEFILKYPRLEYPNEELDMIGSIVRSSELPFMLFENRDISYAENFWERFSRMSDCELYALKFDQEKGDTSEYISSLKNVFEYFTRLFKSTNPLDVKMLVLLGIATYSYKRLLELVNHNLFNTVTGRTITRVIIENYIMMKYLIKNEADHENIWIEYQYYGIGLYKLVLTRVRETEMELKKSHVDSKYIEYLVNEYTNEEFINMDTSYFDNQRIRDKAIAVNEKELWGLYYDYDSSFEHGLWGAIRESTLLKCQTAGHQFHCVPDYENEQILKSVWHDSANIMKKIVFLLDEIYGLPDFLIDEVKKFEG